MNKDIMLASFEKLQFAFHRNYAVDFKLHQESKDLIIVFSPTARFNLYRHELNKNIIFVADRKLNYYMLNPGRQTKLIYDFVISAGFSNVVFLGSSKGGTGALLWSSIFSKISNSNSIKVSCFAFSPQTLLYPYNENISFPSYKKIFDTLDNNDSLKVCLCQYGNLKKFVEETKALTTIVYSSNYSVDKIEAERVCGGNVVHVQIPLPFHGAITPFLIDRNDPNSIKRISEKLFMNASRDEDLKSSLPSNVFELHNILDCLRVSSLNKFIEAFS